MGKYKIKKAPRLRALKKSPEALLAALPGGFRK